MIREACNICGRDDNHYHCVKCGGVTGMYGHWKGSSGYSCQSKPSPAATSPSKASESQNEAPQAQGGPVAMNPAKTEPFGLKMIDSEQLRLQGKVIQEVFWFLMGDRNDDDNYEALKSAASAWWTHNMKDIEI